MNLQAQSNDLIIDHISTSEGLAHEHVHCVYADSYGFLWIGTDDGLQRYDGYDFVVYKNYTQDTTSLSSPIVILIEEDDKGNLWIVTHNGLNLYERQTDSFVQFPFDFPEEYGSSQNLRIRAIANDRNNSNYLWVGTESRGLHLLDKVSKKFYPLLRNSENSYSLSSENIRSLFLDDSGNLWIGTDDAGLNRIDLKTIQVTPDNRYDVSKLDSVISEHYFNNPDSGKFSDPSSVVYVYQDNSNTLWVMLNSGIFIFDYKTKSFYPSPHFTSFFEEHPDVHFHEMFEDNQGKYWFGAHNTLFQLNVEKNEMKEYIIQGSDIRSSSNQALCFDKAGNIWFATWNGLFRVHRQADMFYNYVNKPNNPNSLNSDFIHAILADQSGRVWIGTNKGLSVMVRDLDGNVKFTDYSKLHQMKFNKIESIVEDNRRSKWISTENKLVRINPKVNQTIWYNTGDIKIEKLLVADDKLLISSPNGVIYRAKLNDLYSYRNTEEMKFDIYFNFSDFSMGSISDFIRDRYGHLWIATENDGVIIYDPNSGMSKIYRHEFSNPSSLSNNEAVIIHEDRNGNILIGTEGGGLNWFNRQSESFRQFRIKDGLSSDFIRGILDDNHGNLWVTTNRGLTKFDLKTKKLRNYEIKGFEYWSTYCEDKKSGFMYFGGGMGLTVFHPDSIKGNSYVPPVLLTKFTRYSEEHDGDLIIDRTIYTRDHIELSYKDNIISFEFATLDFNKSKKCGYSYSLEGFNSSWLDIGTKREVTFTNLDPGTYTLKVKNCNEDGVWNKNIASVRIFISPPWWQTWWAYSIYVFVILVFLAGVRKYELSRRKEKEERRILELENERKSRELEEARELQLSMLPKELPRVQTLDIATYMKTATEVGGDFYDFHFSANGTLTVIVADATGHGMQAGTMVAITKGLFHNLAEEHDLKQMIQQFNRSLYTMGLQPLLVSLMILRVKEGHLEIVNGGMPGVLIFQKQTNSIHELEAGGPPLGAFVDYPYEQSSLDLARGDIILSMSDGFVEKINEKNEILGFEKCKEILKANASGDAQHMIDQLVKAGETWGENKKAGDDITFVIIKHTS